MYITTVPGDPGEVNIEGNLTIIDSNNASFPSFFLNMIEHIPSRIMKVIIMDIKNEKGHNN